MLGRALAAREPCVVTTAATAVALAAVVHVVALVPYALAGAAALDIETVSRRRSVRFFGPAADQQDG